MRFSTLLTVAVALLLANNVEAISLHQKAYQADLQSNQEIFAQLHAKADAQGFFDFLKDGFKKVTDFVGGLFKGAQVASKAYVQQLAQQQGLAQVPKLSLAELTELGFNKNAFAQMDIRNLSDDDLKQVVLLGLADDDVQV